MEDDKFALHGFPILIMSEEMTYDWLKKINKLFLGLFQTKNYKCFNFFGVLMFVDKKVEFCVNKT
jgi:hypothetical protein